MASTLSLNEKVAFIALGLFASWVASALPALEAMLAPPRISLSQSQTEERFRQRLRRGVPWLSMIAIAGGFALLQGLKHEALFASLFLVLLGFALWIPQIIRVLTGVALHLTSRSWILVRLSLDATQRHLTRTGIAVTALSLAFAVSLGMEQMVSSFRKEMVSWLDNYVHAELYVAPHGYSTSRSDVTLSRGLVQRLIENPVIQDYSSQRHVNAQSNLGKLRLVAVRPSAKIETLFHARESVPGYSWKMLQTQAVVAISEALSHRLSLEVGEKIELFTPRGRKTYSVAAIFTDYVTDQGLMFMDRNEYMSQFDDDLTTTMHFFLKDPKESVSAQATLQNLPGFQEEARVTTQQQVKGGSIVIFDRTFQITEALRILAVAISMIGLFSALMAIQLGRAYEIGVQRAMGLLPFEIFLILTLQNLWLGFLTGILAVPLSQYIAWFLGSVLNPRSFGWTIPTSLSLSQALSTMGLTLVSSFVAGLYPSYRMSKVPLALTLKEKSEI
ncbi:MAG: FtsX-like permease family protein [Bdellovibrionales bacterium]|nr:FtsX-like permease family protein [Bdellovibrionales bacterium]